MRYPNKAEWMATPEYQQLRLTLFRSQCWRCQDCGETLPLELHHVSYVFGKQFSPKYGTPWGEEELSDVVGLCRECHLQRHLDINGEFWADPDEKEAYWFTYWEEQARD